MEESRDSSVYLDRDFTTKLRVTGAVHLTYSTLAEQIANLVRTES